MVFKTQQEIDASAEKAKATVARLTRVFTNAGLQNTQEALDLIPTQGWKFKTNDTIDFNPDGRSKDILISDFIYFANPERQEMAAIQISRDLGEEVEVSISHGFYPDTGFFISADDFLAIAEAGEPWPAPTGVSAEMLKSLHPS